MKDDYKIVAGGLIGAFISAVIIVLALGWFNPHLYTVYISNDEAIANETFNTVQHMILYLRDRHIILSPQEYTNNIVSYYNTFIVILVGLLATFSILGYFHLKHVSKNEIIILLKEMIRESKDFENTMKEYAAGWFDYSEDLENLNNKIAEMGNDLENLSALNIKRGTKNGDKREKTVNKQK